MKKTQFFTLQSGPNPSAQKWLYETFSELFLELPEAIVTGSPDALLDKLAAHLRRCSVFIIACEPARFLSFKEQLLHALGYTAHRREHIMERQSEPCAADCLFPVGAAVFLSEDGRYNGFAMHCGKQELIFLPLDTSCLAQQRPQIFDYLARRMQQLSKVSPLRSDAQAVIVEALLQKMSNGSAGHQGPIVPESIVPMEAPLPSAPALPALPPVPLYEIDLLRTRRMERSEAAAKLRRSLQRLSEQELRCTLMLSPVWDDIAMLIGEAGGSACFQIERSNAAAKAVTPEDALRLSEQHASCHSGCCAVVTSLQAAKRGSHQTVIALSGPFEHAQVRIAALEDGNPSACSPELADALLSLLCSFLCPEEEQAPEPIQSKEHNAISGETPAARDTSPAPAVRIRSLEPAAEPARGRTRAVTAACLAATTVAASLFFALYTPGASANAAEEPSTTAYIDIVDYTVTENALALEDLTVQLLGSVSTPQSFRSLTDLFTNSGELLRIFIDWLIQASKNLLGQLPAVTSPASGTTAVTAAKDNSSSSDSVTPASKGTYTFQVVGFGHGVGLSQEGAKVLAAQGKSAEQIIKHYYGSSNIAIKKDNLAPIFIKHAGVDYPIDEYIARITYGEIGRVGLVPDEALKAQMICAYTMAKRKNFSTTETDQHLLSAADWNLNFTKQFHAGMLALAREARGLYVTYDGAIANTLYFSSCGGYTATARFAWDESTPPAYLTGGKTSPEALDRSTVSFTSDKIRELVSAYNKKYPSKKISLGNDVSQWIKVLSVDPNGYVEYMQIGDRKLTGGTARLNFFTPANIRSHNFTMSFTPQ